MLTVLHCNYAKVLTFVAQLIKMTEVYLMLGSNLGDRKFYLDAALEKINAEVGKIVRMSGDYQTEPWGTSDTRPYLNKAITINTELSALDLLNKLLSIEQNLGRSRSHVPNEPRTIDIDILFYGNESIHEPSLLIPHPRLHLRRFVLEPLNEISPDLIHPFLNQTIAELLKECKDTLRVKLWVPFSKMNTDYAL